MVDVSDDSIQSLLAKHVRAARETCLSLKSKRVSPHVLRHSAAMELLQAGVNGAVIALWLGHESVETTQTYLHATSRSRRQRSPSSVRWRQAHPLPPQRPPACFPRGALTT
jgi:site-specific recombinase XerD